jgi:ribosomal-protein-alanine N-acetyltransferase
MISSTASTIRSAKPSDLSKLANLIHFEAYVHRHLDYRPPLDWIGQEPFLVLEEGAHIKATLACPPDPPEVVWVRLFAASMQISAHHAWEILWTEAKDKLSRVPLLKYIAAIPLYTWFETFLRRSNFQKTNSIVMLSLDIKSLPDEPPNSQILIRPLKYDDLEQVETIDRMSFSPMWVNSRQYLEIAFRQSLVATVAQIDGEIVGYQISTSSPIGGHLARLAVSPEMQGHGVGYAILFDLMRQFMHRATRTITVNTQKDNHASLSLYQRMGFGLTGEEYPCYQLGL